MATLRSLTVYAQNEPLTPTEPPNENPVTGNIITLDRYYPGLRTGQKLILIGNLTDLPAITNSELLTIKDITVTGGLTALELEQVLTHKYVRSSVIINGNVAPATQGETVRESLGSGDAGKVFQRFILKQPPLTYVSAANATGAVSTLEIRVNDLRWHETESLLDAGPQDRVYITRLDDAGRTTVMFGDGQTGARLPTGPENVKAIYRKGMGLGGLVKANQLSQLSSRPAGVKGVNNPMDAAGAADRESITEARQNAPLPILTLGRVVSVQDYADFARAFAGVGKALATWTWLGQRRGVFLTVAGIDGRDIDRAGALYRNLVRALRAAGDPNVTFRVDSYKNVFFKVAANVQIATDFLPAKVLSAIETALRRRFSFAARAFGQPVAYSEVVAAIQQVPGVVAVELTRFSRTDSGIELLRLEAAVPQPDNENREMKPAELLILDPNPVSLTVA